MEFFQVKTLQQVKDILGQIAPLGTEPVSLQDALGRVLAEPIICSDDVPPFTRSAMDGYAVTARDTFGTSEANPSLLDVTGEVPMGERPPVEVEPGQAVKIATGGMLPQGADAVVMVEYTQVIDEKTIEVYRPVAPRENIVQKGEDIKKGETVLAAGHRLRPQDLGALAALGVGAVTVYRRPLIGIISTGNELVPVNANLRVGQIRDTNTYTVSALALEADAVPFHLGIVRDELDDLQQALEEGLSKGDVVVISGGSSVGTRDLTIAAINTLPDAEIFVHGVAISPGKPTILGRVRGKIVWGLPGHTVSTMIVFTALVTPCLLKLGGRTDWDRSYGWPLKATVTRNIPSAQGREDYVRVTLRTEAGTLMATPLFGKSGSISTMVKGDGLVKIEMEAEGVQEGDTVEVYPF